MKLLPTLLLLISSSFPQTNKPIFNEDQTRLLFNRKVLLAIEKDGYMRLSEIRFSPDGKRFLVLACGFECSDNVGFLFNADGTGKRNFTGRWDWILQNKVEWSADGQFVYYYRIQSTGADPPPKAPREGWMQVAVRTGTKSTATARRLKPNATYAVFRISQNDPLNIRAAPGLKTKIVGTIPFDGKGIQGLSETKQMGKEVWAKIKFGEIVGWVNQSYLYEVAQTK